MPPPPPPPPHPTHILPTLPGSSPAGYPVAADPGHLLAAGVHAFGGAALAPAPAAVAPAPAAPAAAPAAAAAVILPASSIVIPPDFSVKELKEANTTLSALRTPGG